jgi:hypothetical protein
MHISNTGPFQDFIKTVVLLIIPELRHGVLYTSAQICVEVWDHLDKGEHILAGRAISFLEATGQLPLVADQKTSTNLNRYQLR